jgi:hypothetical protein
MMTPDNLDSKRYVLSAGLNDHEAWPVISELLKQPANAVPHRCANCDTRPQIKWRAPEREKTSL